MQCYAQPKATIYCIKILLGNNSSGVAQRSDTLSNTNSEIDFGDIVLDNTAPGVLEVSPLDGVQCVPVDSVIEVIFSESMEPGSFSAGSSSGNVTLMNGTTSVAGSLSFLDDDTRAVFQPDDPLESNTLYTFSVRGVPDGPIDAVGLQLVDTFASTFTTTDIIPPTVDSVSPSDGGDGVLPEAIVRIDLAESVQDSLTVTLKNGRSQVVNGDVAMAFGDTVVIFTPKNFLVPNTDYTVEINGIEDRSGNDLEVDLNGDPLNGSPLVLHFSTVDTMAPVVNFFSLQGTPIEGATVTVIPDLTGDDVASVKYVITSQAPQVVTTAPFAVNVLLPMGMVSADVAAVAVDEAGNRSAPETWSFSVIADQLPTVTLTNLSGAVTSSPGQTLDFEVTANDDLELSRILFSAVGAMSLSDTISVSGGQSSFSTSMDLLIPADTISQGIITFQAVAVDSAGKSSDPATIIINIVDVHVPSATFVSPVNNARIIPGQTVDVVTMAADDAGLQSVTLTTIPDLGGPFVRSIDPGTKNTTQTFSLSIPGTMEAPATISVFVSATDTSDNKSSQVGRTLQIADTITPLMVSLKTENNATRVLADQSVTLQAQASDNVAIAGVRFDVDGNVTMVQVPTPGQNATAEMTFTVPLDAADGSTITIEARALDTSNNLSAPEILTLDVGDLVPPAAVITAPAEASRAGTGDTLIVTVQAEDDVGVSRVDLNVSGVIMESQTQTIDPAALQTQVNFNVSIPAQTLPGLITLSVTARDLAGNDSAVATMDVTIIDNTAPDVQITSPMAGVVIWGVQKANLLI